MTLPTDVRVLEARPFFSLEKSRTPLKFGGVVMDKTVYCHVRVTVENRQGSRAEGWGAIFLADLWAWPSTLVSHEMSEALMREMVTAWCARIAECNEYAHPVDLFWRLEPELVPISDQLCKERRLPEPMPRMGALICASPVDAAVHDAFGIAADIDVYRSYGPDHMAHDLSEYLGPEFAGRYISDYLRPLDPLVDVFHLVGGLDKLTECEITPDDPLDGLPVSLDQWIRFEGLHCLKVKLRGDDLPWDLDRMLAVVEIARQEHQQLGIDDLWLTADTNEMCESPSYMVELLRKLRQRDARAYDSLLYIEQPCDRDLSRHRHDVRELATLKPVIVDEALASLDDLELALELGYSGGALKSCKCQSEELVIAAKMTHMGLPFAVQDLANPGIALLHSVGLAGRLNTIRGVESNSRQFYPDTSRPERAVHPGVYRLTNGRINTSTIRGPGLGYRWDEIGRTFDEANVW